LVAVVTSGVLAQELDPSDQRKTVQIVRTVDAPLVDGRLDEDIWTRAAVLEELHQIEPTEYAAPTERTRILLAYDAEALYVGVRLWDSEPEQITAHVLRQGEPLWDEDTFWAIVDPRDDRRSGYRFEVNANGVRSEGLYQNVSDVENDWDGIWRAAATRDAEGWTAEIAVPFKTLSFDPSNTQWGLNFGRQIKRKNERIGWVSRNREQNPSISGVLVGISDMEQGRGLDIVPSLSVRQQRTYSPTSSSDDVEPSLDVFYKITSLLNGSLTINTDFSATEVDDRQINLTRFSQFFPEKREFFLRDGDVFEFGRFGGGFDGPTRSGTQNGRPFFSRRIGLDDSGQPVDLRYGGKVAGRIGDWTVGSLAVRQDEFDNIAPSTLFVGRATANVLSESSVGIIVTNGDPLSDLDNSLAGVDLRYLNTELPNGRTVEGEAWYQQSDTEGLVGDDAAFGGGLRFPTRDGWTGDIAVKELDVNFYPALGFANNRGVRDQAASVGYTHRPGNSYMRSIYGGVDAQAIDLLEGGLQSDMTELRMELDNQTGDVLRLGYTVNTEALQEPFEISEAVTIPTGKYDFDFYGFEIETGQHRAVAGAFEYRRGELYDGQQDALAGRITWRPSPHFRVSAEYEYHDINLPEGAFVARTVRLQADIVFSSTLSWVNLLQYDNDSETVGINSRLHWIPEAGREGFLVLNHNLEDWDKDNSFHSTSADVVVKLSYIFRF
jgi:hypothetical protein